MCETPAGRGKHASVPRYTSYTHREHDGQTCTHRTFANETRRPAAGKTAGAGKTAAGGSKKAWTGGIVVVLAILLSLAPLVGEFFEYVRYNVGMAGDYWMGGSYEVAPEPDDVYETITLASVIGTHCVGTADTGEEIELTVEDETFGEYRLTITGEDFTYTESGESWCDVSDWPNDDFDCYVICLDALESAFAGEGVPPARFEGREDYASWWATLLIDRQTGVQYLLDEEESGLLGENVVAQMSELWAG